MSSQEHSEPSAHPRNEGTRIVSLPSLLPTRFSAREAFLTAFEDLRSLAEIVPTGGFGVAVIDPVRGYDQAGVLLPHAPADQSTLIVGRHDRTDLPVRQDPTVALRHLWLRLETEETGSRLRVLDLLTGQGFGVSGVDSVSAMTTDGPILVTVGTYAVFLFPGGLSWDGGPQMCWDRFCQHELVDLRPEAPQLNPSRPIELPPARARASDSVTRITLVSELSRPQLLEPREPLPTNTAGTMTMKRGPYRWVYPVTEEQLDRGVLFGRYPRCELPADQLDNSYISRVHLLVLRDASGEVWAFDTASSNGTLVAGLPRRAFVLSHELAVGLGGDTTLRWNAGGSEASPHGSDRWNAN